MMTHLSLRLTVTGDQRFAERHRFLFDSIAERCSGVDFVTNKSFTIYQRTKFALLELTVLGRGIVTGALPFPFCLDDIRRLRRRFIMSQASFKAKSRFTQSNLNRLPVTPQIVLHIFGLYRPFWTQSEIPSVHYLDYTTALARRNWPPNLTLPSEAEFECWLTLERQTYLAASHLFTMSGITARSLVNDYGVPPERVSAVGSGGRFREPFDGTKCFGSKQLLFNANPFGRKGGDLVLGAFQIVRSVIPEATLVVVGITLKSLDAGVVNPGYVSDGDDLRRLFLSSDLVVAPARADPFPGFIIEAMSHGVPCIVSSVDGMPEIVDNGLNGTVLALNTIPELARVIIELLGNVPKLESFSAAALLKAREQFAWSSIAKRIVDKLTLILVGSKKSHVAGRDQSSNAFGPFASGNAGLEN